MSVREDIEHRLVRSMPDGPDVDLPRRLKTDRVPVRTGMMKRLSASRIFALGDRSGVLTAAVRRSGRGFRLDTRQRVIVKALVVRHLGRGKARAAALGKHIAYISRQGAGVDGQQATFISRDEGEVRANRVAADWASDRHHFRFIISPEHGDRIQDMAGYTRSVMARVSGDLGEPGLQWIAACHFDTDQPHVHVLIRGRRADGRDLVIPRDYIGYGFRARAQEMAQERLGDLSRADAERRVWRDTEAHRFTPLDRRLVAAADADGLVDDGFGASDAWAALCRGRLRHLEGLGLAQRVGKRFQLASHLEASLRDLQLRGDVIRTLNQRRLEGAAQVRMLGATTVRGVVTRSGLTDEIGSASWVFVKDAAGVEHYARLATGRAPAAVGSAVDLIPGDRGVGILKDTGRQLSL